MSIDSRYTILGPLSYKLGFQTGTMPADSFGSLMEKDPISYKFVPDSFLEKIEGLDIPARSNLPFAANWLGKVEELKKTQPNCASWLATLIYTEWSLTYTHHSIHKSGLFGELKDRAGLKKAALQSGIINEDFIWGAKPSDLELKWWLDDMALRIRSLWDKIVLSLGESLDRDKKLKVQGKSYQKRVNFLINSKNKLLLTSECADVFDILMEHIQDIDYVKGRRDAELHSHATRYAEIYGVPSSHESADQVYPKLYKELNKVREALMCTIGILLLRAKELDSHLSP